MPECNIAYSTDVVDGPTNKSVEVKKVRAKKKKNTGDGRSAEDASVCDQVAETAGRMLGGGVEDVEQTVAETLVLFAGQLGTGWVG